MTDTPSKYTQTAIPRREAKPVITVIHDGANSDDLTPITDTIPDIDIMSNDDDTTPDSDDTTPDIDPMTHGDDTSYDYFLSHM